MRINDNGKYMKEKIILYGAGRYGLLALDKYGKSHVAFFCDKQKSGETIEGIEVLSFDRLVEICQGNEDYRIVITPEQEWARAEIRESLDNVGLRYEVFDKLDTSAGGSRTIHIRGNGCEMECRYIDEDVSGFENRIPLTYGLVKCAIESYAHDFLNKSYDIPVYIGDHSLDAYYQCENVGAEHIFSYNSVSAIEDRVIPIPDYRACYNPNDYHYDETPDKCKEARGIELEDPRIVWRGSLRSDDCRRWLEIISHRNPDVLLVEDSITYKEHKFVPMLELPKHKYLLDIRGYGWSDRLKILLQLGRPIFMVDRPYKEWYTDKLISWEHYIPVKEDMSDLVERYHYMEEHPEKYDEIVKNMNAFAEEYLSPEAVLRYTRDVILKYGIVESIER